jgi:5-oxoprolinase (ATP-hydrolysing)
VSDARVSFDIGGTFTDLVLDDAVALRRHKVLTTPARPAAGALAGLDGLIERAGIGWADVAEVVHGTTLVTNALIERRFPRTGLLTTRGFRDVLAMGRQQRYDAYDLHISFPAPLVPRELRLEVAERTLASGEVALALDAAEAVGAARRLVDAGVESVAVCLLHAYVEPANERVAAAAVREAFPELAVVASSEVAPEIREYERAVTATANAAVRPLVDRYLDELAAGLAERGYGGPLSLMQSNGGTAPADLVRPVPIRLLESGPAGGARAGAGVGARLGRPVLAFDMGGTTAKACLAEADGRLPLIPELEIAREHRFKPGSGLPVRLSSVDLIEIGAGGGSIAAVDQLGLLRVGPESAGADPGPACYGFGGTRPTVTDANLVLGFLGPGARLGESVTLDAEAAEAALRGLAERIGMDPLRAALGVHRVVNEQMAAAARVHVIDRGADPRGVALVVSGGAGPAHACGVARLLGSPEVIVPPGAGTASAAGFLTAPASLERSFSLPATLERTDWVAVQAEFAGAEEELAAALALAGVPRSDIRFERSADARLVGQVHVLAVAVDEVGPAVEDAFRAVYRERFRMDPGAAPVEVLTWRCRAAGPARRVEGTAVGSSAAGAPSSRPVTFDESGPRACPVYSRAGLAPGTLLDGPAIVEEPEATTVVWPGDRIGVESSGDLHVWLGAVRS